MQTLAEKKQIMAILDLTRLNDADTLPGVLAFCQRASGPLGQAAAVCVQPSFVSQAKRLLVDTGIRVATVANFPTGDEPCAETLATIDAAIAAGADEIDVVAPYTAFLAGEDARVASALRQYKAQCADTCLKVILETGLLATSERIYDLAVMALDAGADFIKTSTGKVAEGATEKAASAMLQAIAAHHQDTGRLCGLKLSGGIKTPAQVMRYFDLARNMFGADYLQPQTFRVGASSLLDALLSE